ncbi:hypothetical protein D3C80_1725190 [compost metagenome]
MLIYMRVCRIDDHQIQPARQVRVRRDGDEIVPRGMTGKMRAKQLRAALVIADDADTAWFCKIGKQSRNKAIGRKPGVERRFTMEKLHQNVLKGPTDRQKHMSLRHLAASKPKQRAKELCIVEEGDSFWMPLCQSKLFRMGQSRIPIQGRYRQTAKYAG